MALNRTNLKQTPIPVVPRTMQIVNSDGTVTRSGQLLLQQLQASDALQGTHDGRPSPGDAPDGALYVESDRLVLYSNINGAWHYVAGTMWGTINPDQRPTDLGVNDAGFDFRTVDDPAREFIWSQAYWVEVTPVRYGTHAQRLAVVLSGIIDQMLWVETDRGDVTYQNQSHAWHYIAGTLYGTISPDQRPTDLGANDIHFPYRATDTGQTFYWSGSAWVETTAQSNSAQIAYAPASVTLTGSPQNIPGATLSLPKAGTYLIIGVFYFLFVPTDNGSTLIGNCPQGGGAVAALLVSAASTEIHATVSQQWLYTAPGPATVNLQAYKAGGSGTSSVQASQTSISAIWISP